MKRILLDFIGLFYLFYFIYLLFIYYFIFYFILFYFILLYYLLFSEESLKCVTDEESFSVFEHVKEPNKSVLGYLACFASHLSEFSSTTGVKDSDLASVLSPCVLRCPYSDVNEMISAAEKQTGFVLGLLDAAKGGIIVSEDFKRSLERVKMLKSNEDEKVIHINVTEEHKDNVEDKKGDEDKKIDAEENKGNEVKNEENGKENEVNNDFDDLDDVPPPLPSMPAPPIPTCPPPPIPDMF